MLYKWGWVDQSGRAFNTIERLMSEARILWIYISRLELLMKYKYSIMGLFLILIGKNSPIVFSVLS